MTPMASIMLLPVIFLPLRSMTPTTAHPEGFRNCPSRCCIVLSPSDAKISITKFIISPRPAQVKRRGQICIFGFFYGKYKKNYHFASLIPAIMYAYGRAPRLREPPRSKQAAVLPKRAAPPARRTEEPPAKDAGGSPSYEKAVKGGLRSCPPRGAEFILPAKRRSRSRPCARGRRPRRHRRRSCRRRCAPYRAPRVPLRRPFRRAPC